MHSADDFDTIIENVPIFNGWSLKVSFSVKMMSKVTFFRFLLPVNSGARY